MLTDGQVEAFHEGRVEVPAVRGQHLLHSHQRAEDHPMTHAHQTPAAHRLDHLGVAQARARHPARPSTASAALTSPVLTARRRAKSSSSCTCVTCTSCKKYWEKAVACSATSTSHARTVVGSTANTRATARMPKPSASAPTAHTSRSGATRLPCNGVPCVSRKYPRPVLQESCRQGPPLG